MTVFHKWTAGYYACFQRVFLYVEWECTGSMVSVTQTLVWKQKFPYTSYNFVQVYHDTDLFTLFMIYRAHTVEAARVPRYGQTHHLTLTAKMFVGVRLLFLCRDDAGCWWVKFYLFFRESFLEDTEVRCWYHIIYKDQTNMGYWQLQFVWRWTSVSV